MNITVISTYVHRAEVYKNIELLISMSKDEKRRNIGKNISCNTPKVRSGKSYARLSQNKDRYDLPPVDGEMAHSAKGGVRKTPTPTSSALPLKKGQKDSKPSFMQKALKAAAMFALALGTTSLSADSQAQASSNFLNIRGASDIETQVLEEQDKRRRFLTNKSGTKFTNKIVSTSILRINPEVLNAVQNSIGQRDGVMRDLALRASEATLAESNPYLYGSTVVEESISPWGEKNFDASEASVRNSREGNVSDPLLSTSLTSSPEGGRGVVVGINSIETIEVDSNLSLRGDNNMSLRGDNGLSTKQPSYLVNAVVQDNDFEQTAGLLHSVRNDMKTGNADTVIASEILPPVEGEMGDSPKGVNNTQPPTPTMSVLPPASMG